MHSSSIDCKLHSCLASRSSGASHHVADGDLARLPRKAARWLQPGSEPRTTLILEWLVLPLKVCSEMSIRE